jgi:hypothetical protein
MNVINRIFHEHENLFQFDNKFNLLFKYLYLFILEQDVIEAIALYDYKGRSDKEISFRKGQILSIKGQLSLDWWQGSLSTRHSPSTNTNSPTSLIQSPLRSKIGYIPDKYIALRYKQQQQQQK